MYIVTGANGFIGSALVWDLNKNGIDNIECVDEVSLTTRPKPLEKRQYKHFTLHDQFINSLEKYKEAKCVIHLGACSSTTETNWDYLKKVNIEYSKTLWLWCTKHSIPYIYASSAATYGNGEFGYCEDIDPNQLAPLNLYGKSKVEFDKWCLEQTNRPPYWYGLRFFNVYGPNEFHKESQASVAFKAFYQVRQTNKLKLFRSYNEKYKDGEQVRDFVYIKDITRWIIELLEKKPTSGIYNMGLGKGHTWLDLAKGVFYGLDKELNIEFIEMPESIKNQYQYWTEANMKKWFEAGMSAPQWDIAKGTSDYMEFLSTNDSYL